MFIFKPNPLRSSPSRVPSTGDKPESTEDAIIVKPQPLSASNDSVALAGQRGAVIVMDSIRKLVAATRERTNAGTAVNRSTTPSRMSSGSIAVHTSPVRQHQPRPRQHGRKEAHTLELRGASRKAEC